MLINPLLARFVREAWIADQEHSHRGQEKHAYPDEERLAVLLDIAFRASLVHEEGRSVRGSLTLLSPDELETLEIPKRRESSLVVRLSDPRQLDVEVVAKLATATDVGSSSLLISCFDDVYKIWGIIYYNRNPSFFTAIPAVFPECRHFPPDTPTVELSGPGSLRITRSGSVIARIEKGEFRAAVPTPFTSLAMGSILYKLFDIKVERRHFLTDEDGQKSDVLISCLEYLLFQIDKRGGGATVIFVPDSSTALARDYAVFPWKSEGGLEFSKLIQARNRFDKEQQNNNSRLLLLKANEVFRQRLDNLAQLASLDGALLLSPCFALVGFGVKLHAPEYTNQVCEGPDGFGNRGEIIDFKRLGTRHNSALCFIASVLGSVGFVASEDGPIRGLAMSSCGTVSCWPDCRLSMFA